MLPGSVRTDRTPPLRPLPRRRAPPGFILLFNAPGLVPRCRIHARSGFSCPANNAASIFHGDNRSGDPRRGWRPLVMEATAPLQWRGPAGRGRSAPLTSADGRSKHQPSVIFNVQTCFYSVHLHVEGRKGGGGPLGNTEFMTHDATLRRTARSNL